MNFDEVIDRRGTHANKWDAVEQYYPSEDILPLWIADMDFPIAEGIQEAIQQRAKHPIYGYTRDEGLVSLYTKHFNEAYDHGFDDEHVALATGVIYSMNAAIECLSKPDDGIMINSPIYPPFFRLVQDNERSLVDVPMKIEDGQYRLDFEAMEKAPACKLLLLCNPHNPTGRNFTQAELEQLAHFAERHDMIVIADEIHADFVYEANFVPFSEINEYTKSHTVTCVSCTKSFNLAGLKASALMCHDKEILKKIKVKLHNYGADEINIFGLVASRAAYETGAKWQQESMEYLKANRDFAYDYVQEHLPHVNVFKPEATMFLWLDCSYYGLADIKETLAKEAGILLNAGKTFSKDHAGFVRLNFACPRCELEEALKRLKDYFEKISE